MAGSRERSLYAASGGGSIKGAAFREFLIWYEQDVGARGFARLVEQLPEWTLTDLDPQKKALGVLASTWYQDLTVHALLDTMVRELNPKEMERMASAGSEFVMNQTLRGLYRMLFEWMASPSRYGRFGPKLWGSYYDSGKFEIVHDEKGRSAHCTISQWNTHHDFICQLNRGASVAIYTAMLCTEVTCERISCVSDGSDSCQFITRWQGEA
jgi:hypothetical protein